MYNDIIQVKSPIVQGDDIIGQEYHTYTPYTTSFNNNDEVHITIQSQDLYVLPSQSYLYIEFSVSRGDGVPLGNEEAGFTFLYPLHLFSEMRYELNGFEIDRCKKPGITSTMKMLTAMKNEDKLAFKLLENYSNCAMSTRTYYAIVPLRFLFGFCDDYNKIILNSKHELILVRSRVNNNAYIATVDNNLQINVSKIQWKVPHVSLSDRAKLSMLKTISRNDDLFLTYRSWDLYEVPVLPTTTRHSWSVKTTSQVTKPRFVVVSFQTNRNQISANDASAYDHCNISNMKLYLNNERFPYDDLDLNFAANNYHELYNMYSRSQLTYYNGTSWPNPSSLDYNGFVLRPMFVFDCSKSEENIKPGMVDVRLEFEARSNIAANTSAHCLIIHDNLVRYSPFTSMVQREM